MTDFPIGSIIMLRDGNTIPDGWVVCDGANGTRNLIGKFPLGASVDADLGVSGGVSTHTHSNYNTGPDGGHGHTGATVNSTYSATSKEWTGINDTAENHYHSVTITVVSVADHTHTIGITGSGSHLPPYVKRVFIQKIA